MEKMIEQETPVGVLDLSLHETTDHFFVGGGLWNPEGKNAFVDHLTRSPPASRGKILDCHINDPGFAQAALENLRELSVDQRPKNIFPQDFSTLGGPPC